MTDRSSNDEFAEWSPDDEYFIHRGGMSGQYGQFRYQDFLWLLRGGYIRHEFTRVFDGDRCHYFVKD